MTAGLLSHYLLPAGNVAIAFSGGRTSAYMLHQILEANGGLPDRCVVSFQNTGREMPETLGFVPEAPGWSAICGCPGRSVRIQRNQHGARETP